MENEKNSRRQFLRTTALATLSAAFLPGFAKADPKPEDEGAGGCHPTTRDYYGQGPFYTANAPTITNNQLAGAAEPGTRLVLSGVVQTLDCTAVIPNTLIDIWHANDAGAYDNSGFNLRGITYSNAQGFFLFETVLPGKYLNGASYRPRHIHFRITPPGFPTLVTQLYFEGDTDIPGDAAASITTGTFDATHRIIPITLNAQGKYEGTWDMTVDGSGTLGFGNLHAEKGMIYAISPNPFSKEIQIHYGVFQEASVSIQIFDLAGRQVAILDPVDLLPEKYQATWSQGHLLPAGVYFVALKLNDLQVHYLKVVKE